MGKNGEKLEQFYVSCANKREEEIIPAEVRPDHVHMCVKIPPKMSVSGFMGFLKGKSSVKYNQNLAISNLHTETESFGAEGINRW